MNATIATIGAAWVNRDSCGATGVAESRDYPVSGVELLSGRKELVAGPIKNFGRFPRCVKDICAACALALRAAGIVPGSGRANRTGILAAGFDEVMAVNKEYFTDYVAGGRVMGRGNLFIYTTPSSLLAEASILLGLAGPMASVEADAAPCAELLRSAAETIRGGQAEAVACLWQDSETTLCLLAGPRPEAQGIIELDDAIRSAATWRVPADGVCYVKSAYKNANNSREHRA